MKLKAYAKLNLSLNIFPKKLKNGLHRIKFLNCNFDLADKIIIRKADNGILIKCDGDECRDVKCPQNCLAYKTAKLLQKEFPKKIKGVEIFIKKNIPVRAGLGGGSADAATVLRGINALYNLKLSDKKLIKLARKISLDACYSVIGGLCKVEGVQDKITPLRKKFPKYYLVVVVPKIKKPSTRWAYKNLDHRKIGKNLDKFNQLLLSLKPKTYNLKPIDYLHNDFEFSIFRQFPEIRKIKKQLLNSGAENAILAGSGLSVVGFFEKKSEAEKTSRILKKDYSNICFSKIR